jgi:CRISPR-associated protein Csb2
VETLQLHRERWSDPPGSRLVAYVRPRDCFKRRTQPPHRRARQPLIQVARYALDSTVLPLVTETLPVAEAARRALMGIYGRLTEKGGVRGRSAVLSGKDGAGERLRDHNHAYYLPSDEDADGRLDHLTVYAARGFDLDERKAIRTLRDLRTDRDSEANHPLRVLLISTGGVNDYAPGPLRGSDQWISVTPYIAARYAKTRGAHRIDLRSAAARATFLQNDLRTMLGRQLSHLTQTDLNTLDIEPLCDTNGIFRISGRWRPIEFQRFRRKAGDDGGRRLTGAFRLNFTRPVQGPIALGFSSHFGMGLFMPPTDS